MFFELFQDNLIKDHIQNIKIISYDNSGLNLKIYLKNFSLN